MKVRDRLTMIDPRSRSWHPGFIKKLAAGMNKPRYLEIGVYRGETFNPVSKYCSLAVGVDIDPEAISYIRKRAQTNVRLGTLQDLEGEFANVQFDLIFIDADHRKDAVIADFSSALNMLAPGGLILLHDTWPGSVELSNEKYCGSAYLSVPELRGLFTDWNFVTLPFHPGLTFCQSTLAGPAWLR